MNYGLLLLSLILYISKPNVDRIELSFHSHAISHLTQRQALIYQFVKFQISCLKSHYNAFYSQTG